MRVLCVDPAPEDGRATRAALREAGIDATLSGSLAEAREALDESVAGVVTEYDLPDGTGLELVERARTTVPDATCVLFTDAGFDELDTADLGTAVVEYVDKGAPDAREELVDLLEFSVDNRSQTAYPLPDDEDARLDAVTKYVDDLPGVPDASLDRLTRIAAALFDVDAATVGFLDAHQERFVACHEVDVDRLDRERTVCTYAILDDGVTVIPDTQADPRFEGNEALIEASIRFYAGAPIRTAAGDAVGVFCLFDDEPGTLTAAERDLLSALADDVMDRLDLRRRLHEATAGEADE
ncbi:GAF domain-containing protein [Haloplanus halophilus]|uniref:GAF domain-containing protein n=1 Tax=Haloplanus halophilus TaxID=2949993 RepID=UPI00203B42DA|nr:GAF domain-containing protein [Haloplanus sp. GDY1]